MKVAFLLGSLNRGGTETLLLDTLRNIHESSIKPICIYRMKGLLHGEYANTGTSMFELKPKSILDLGYIIKLRRALKKHKTQIAHAQQPIDAFYAYLACLGLKTKVVLSVHGYDFKYPNTAKRILRFIHKRIRLILFVSYTQREYFMQKYGFRESTSKVLYNGISFSKLVNVEHKSIKGEFNIPQGHLLLGSVGNFNPARDQLTICRFLRLLNETSTPFSFIFAGAQSKADPWYWDDCISYCQENNLDQKVFFPGSRNDIPNFLSQLDAFIYSTDHDTFGIAIIEAIYMGLPVFVNDWGVIREVTGNGKHAVLFKTKDEKDLLDKFMQFLSNKDEYVKQAAENARWAGQEYSIQNHLKNLELIYTAII